MRTIACLGIALLCAAPAHAAWNEFEIIQWQKRDVPRLRVLQKLGVTAVNVIADRDGTGTPLNQQTPAPQSVGLRWYIENIATDYYAPYHKYTPNKPVHWLFLEAQARLQANPDDQTALQRQPPYSDPAWRARIAKRLTDTVKDQKQFHPLFYSLGDETGIADLSAYWDFDLSPVSISGFQTWLRGQYPTLAALNTEWGTGHKTWASIQPETTRAAMRRTDDNYAAWNDFKSWADTEFANAVQLGTNAIHRADPNALSAIEGAQMPGWGGYDYTKLATTADVMEVYDMGENLPILRSLNPRLIPLATSFEGTPTEMHRIWMSVLRGARGLVLWDDDDSIVRLDATLTPRAEAYAPVFASLRGDLGRRMVAARPVYDDVAVLYSPVSFRVRWMLDHRGNGDAWMRRAADIENEDNAWRVAFTGYIGALSRMGLRPRIITPSQLASGPPPERVLILPHALAMSDAELRAIALAKTRGVQVIGDIAPGAFDSHARKRAVPVTVASIVTPMDLPSTIKTQPRFTVHGYGIDQYLFRSRGRLLLALQRRATGDTSASVTVTLNGQPARDVVSGKPISANGAVTLDPITPTFLEIGR